MTYATTGSDARVAEWRRSADAFDNPAGPLFVSGLRVTVAAGDTPAFDTAVADTAFDTLAAADTLVADTAFDTLDADTAFDTLAADTAYDTVSANLR